MEQNQKQTQVQGWKDVVITPDMPLSQIVNFLNALNQRLINIEDNFKFKIEDRELTLTQFYLEQAEAELKTMAESKAE